jgi:hypothetical protein
MVKIATLLVETKGTTVEVCEKHLNDIKSELKGIVAIRRNIPLKDTHLMPKLSIMKTGRPDFMLEVKLGQGTDLRRIQDRLKQLAWNVETIIPDN